MKASLIFLIFLLNGLVFSPNSVAQQTTAEEQVLAILDEARNAVQSCQIDKYATYWDTQATIFTTNGTDLWPISKYLEVWRHVCAENGGISFDMSYPKVWVNGNTALVISIANFSFTGPDKQTQSGKNRFTTILRKTSDGWKLFHAHGSDLISPNRK